MSQLNEQTDNKFEKVYMAPKLMVQTYLNSSWIKIKYKTNDELFTENTVNICYFYDMDIFEKPNTIIRNLIAELLPQKRILSVKIYSYEAIYYTVVPQSYFLNSEPIKNQKIEKKIEKIIEELRIAIQRKDKKAIMKIYDKVYDADTGINLEIISDSNFFIYDKFVSLANDILFN